MTAEIVVAGCSATSCRSRGAVRAGALRGRVAGGGVTCEAMVNGEPRELAGRARRSRASIALWTPRRGGRGVAVAVDGEVVPRGAWEKTVLAEGARVEIVAAVQGG